jgi:hypothetical protein
MKKIIFVFSIIVLLSTHTKAQEGFGDVLMQKQAFYEANLELEAMLNGDASTDYERAVFVMENAYRANTIDYTVYEEVLDFHTQNIRLLAEANRDSVLEGLPDVMFETEEQKQERYDMLLNNWAIHHYMTDTTIIRDGEFEYVHMPYNYSYSDPMGVLEWKHTQVMNLLDNKAGNCYAMVNLYMIFAKRLGTDARIGVAPGHVFVMHDGMDGREYFVELSNGSFPGTGTIMTLSYSPLEAVKEGISMRELTEEQAVGMCLVYLGKAYEQSFETKTDGFIYGCAETALEHDSLNLNAMLLKTEVLEERLWSTGKSIDQLQNSGEFREYEALVAELYNKGYREMPQDMKNLIIRGLQKDEGGIILKDNTPTGFQTIDDEGERYATLSWGLFDEVHEPKDVERYGRALFDTKTRKIISLSEVDSLYNRYPMDIGVFAMAVDPLAAKYVSQSPYSAFNNNPVIYNDPTGKGGVLTIDKETKQASLTFNMHLYGESGLNQEAVVKLVQGAYPEWNGVDPLNINVPVAEKWTYNDVEYNLTVTIVVDVMSIDNVQAELDNNDASHNYFEVRDKPDGSGRNKYPYNAGFINSGAFKDGATRASNTMLEELWHSTGALYNQSTTYHSDDPQSVCSGFNVFEEMGVKGVLQEDMDAIRKGAIILNNYQYRKSIAIDFNYTNAAKTRATAILGKKTTTPVDDSFQTSITDD